MPISGNACSIIHKNCSFLYFKRFCYLLYCGYYFILLIITQRQRGRDSKGCVRERERESERERERERARAGEGVYEVKR